MNKKENKEQSLETQEQKPPCRLTTQMTQAIDKKNIAELSKFFAEDIVIGNYLTSGFLLKGKERAIEFFMKFFKDDAGKEPLIHYRLIDNGKLTGILDKRLMKYQPEHDFIIFIEDCKIVKMEIFEGVVNDIWLMGQLEKDPDSSFNG